MYRRGEFVKPKIPDRLMPELRSELSDQEGSAIFKLHLPRGRSVYGVEIDSEGRIIKVGDRMVFSESDVGFPVSRLSGIEKHS